MVAGTAGGRCYNSRKSLMHCRKQQEATGSNGCLLLQLLELGPFLEHTGVSCSGCYPLLPLLGQSGAWETRNGAEAKWAHSLTSSIFVLFSYFFHFSLLPSVHSFNQHLLSTYHVLGIMLGLGVEGSWFRSIKITTSPQGAYSYRSEIILFPCPSPPPFFFDRSRIAFHAWIFFV